MRPINVISFITFASLSAALACNSSNDPGSDGPGEGSGGGGISKEGGGGQGPSSCSPATCASESDTCGQIPDSCGDGDVRGFGEDANTCVEQPVGTGGGSGGGSDGLPPSPPGGLQHSSVDALPGGEPTACELGYTVRMLRPHSNDVVPRRMYFDSCNIETSTPSLFVSLTVGENAGLEVGEGTAGAIVKTTLDPGTGKLVPDGVSRQFPECVFMHGITTSDDCGTVAALCRRNWGDDDYDQDSLSSHNSVNWMTQPLCAPHEMWLYEWTNGDITTEPEKYVVHRAVGTNWDYGNNALIWGDDGTYGMAIKSRVVDGGGQCHEADAFLVMNRTDHTLTDRGWSWACGTGHTLFNKPNYNAESSKYALLCGTDYNLAKTPRLGGLFFRLEDGAKNEFLNVNYKFNVLKGGVGHPQPLPDGGGIGAIVGVDGEVFGLGVDDEVPLEPATSIGVVRFNAAGELVGEVNWVVQDSEQYFSYPQLTPLGNGNFLLGWGAMYDLSNQGEMNDNNFRVPMEFWLQEIDVDGNAITEPTLVEGAGWGEQDRMVPLGDGAVGWAYIPDPAIKAGGSVTSCNSDSLQLSVYQSAAK